MAFSRHAYWHALQYRQSKSTIPDHVWISDAHLASVFNRFVNCTLHHKQQQQRRYESRVPGPLEARRRLAKRKNATAWVSPTGTGVGLAGDAVGLFGKDGSEHLKWSSDSQWDRSWPNPFGKLSIKIFYSSVYKKAHRICSRSRSATPFTNSRPRFPDRAF
jgi:hypothetical protein